MRVSRRGIRLFHVWGVAISLDYSWFIFFFLVLWTFGRFYFPRYPVHFSSPVVWALATVAAILLFTSVTLHELSHALVSNRLGFPVRRITLFIFGGVAHMHNEPDTPRTEFLVAGAGPLSSLILWAALTAGAWIASWLHLAAAVAVLILIAQLNLALALFNLVPGLPLDGGRLLRAAVWWRSGSLKRATNWAAKGGEIFAYLLMLAGVLSFFNSQRNGAIVSGLWYLLIGVFVKSAAEQSYRHVLLEDVLMGISVGEIMGASLSVRDSDSLQTLIDDTFMHHKFAAYPVLDVSSHVVGVVELEDLKNVPREEWERKQVAEVMKPLRAGDLPNPATHAFDALRSMLARGVARLPVIDEQGHLAGIVSRADVMNMFEIRNELGEEVTI
jgi:Zn-dependent protease/predicted transcriptional regulator